MRDGSGWITCGAVLGGLAVVFGAFAAHGLDAHFVRKYAGQTRTQVGVEVPAARKYLDDFRTGAEYQLAHALALVGVGLAARQRRSRSLTVAGWSFLGGIVFFSGSLYVLTLTGQKGWGAVAPIGGTLMIVGWAALACGTCPCCARSAGECVPLEGPGPST
jgi:uncharacterized membrane protein YgdD (TMEM256/DUF423 family)